MRRAILAVAIALCVSDDARGQAVPGEFVPSGESVATTTDADSARLNMGAVPLAHAMSIRVTGIGEFQSHQTALDSIAATLTTPLYFGFAGSAGATWQHIEIPATNALGEGFRGDVVTGELGLGYAVLSNLGVGARVRIMGAGGDAGLTPLINGAAALDAGVEWRISPWISLGITGRDLVGARVPLIGLDRSVVAGIGVRPSGTDLFTLGIDGSYSQSGDGWVRAAARVRIPWVGYLRAEGLYDPTLALWRTSAGIELVWGTYAAGGGILAGNAPTGMTAPLGGFASVRYEPVRDRGLPEPGVAISLVTTSELGARSFGHLMLRLEELRRDPSVRALLFAPRESIGGLANAEELRDEFARYRASGRTVECHLVEPTGAIYYACAAADRITMDPAGTLRTAGIRTGFFFLGDALRDIGVRTEFARVGAWKSATEQFTRRGSTREARDQEEQLLDDFYGNFLSGITEGRSHVRGAQLDGGAYTVDRVRAVIERGPYSAREAFRLGLIDAVTPRDVAERSLSQVVGVPIVPFESFAPNRPRRWATGPRVAVLYVDGDMIEGENYEIPFLGMRFTGDRTIRGAIDSLASDSNVAAIVLRVDSGGGAAMAAETIWRSLQRAARSKPVIVSMGSEAASAAYYIAAPAREIFADPSTVTGSIGIFLGKADLSPLLNRLDIGVELLRRGNHADMDSIFRAWSPSERQVVERLILEFYNQFLDRVATGRHMTTEAVNRIGEGRVFAGTRGRSLGLVDRMGGLAAAIDRARELAGLREEFSVSEYPVEQVGLLQSLGSLLTEDPARRPVASILARSELRVALGWLFAVSAAGEGRPLALTEWPILTP